MITSINLPKEFKDYRAFDDQPLVIFSPLSKINLLVGSNNSGKSRFMRLLLSQKYYEIIDDTIDVHSMNSYLLPLIEKIFHIIDSNDIKSIGRLNVSEARWELSLPSYISTDKDVYIDIKRFFYNIISKEPTTFTIGHVGNFKTVNNPSTNKILSLSSDIYNNINNSLSSPDYYRYDKFYIPTLRGLRHLDDMHTDFYAQKTHLDYFPETKSINIFTGLGFYNDLLAMLTITNKERKILSSYVDFLSGVIFDGEQVSLIPNSKTKTVIIKIGKEKEQPVHHLGDGIQSAIILSYLPFITQDPTLFFIEEPELHMHPSLQRKILNLYSQSNKHTFFITTHSNHLLDVTIDLDSVSIFNFKKKVDQDTSNDEQSATFIVEAVDVGHRSSLEELGVRNSSVFLVNSTIWVEGITDRWYLRAYLASYVRHLNAEGRLEFKPEEDTHFSFVEYGGGNIIHFSFLDKPKEEHPIEVDRLCAQAMVVVDGDGGAKLERKAELSKKLKERLIILPVREIENTLPPTVIRNVVAKYERVDTDSLSLPSESDYKDKYLGHFIENWLKGQQGEVKRRGGYDSGRDKRADNPDIAGTIKSKVDFCDLAREELKDFDFAQLPENTQNLTRKIYNFICEHNGAKIETD